MSGNSPYFSVIIPSYNRIIFLPGLIESLRNQSYKDFEIIIVDDGSTDDTALYIQSLNDINIRYIHKQNGGVSSARNVGLQHAKGKYINFFDSDDLAYPNHLAAANTFFEKNKDCKVVIFDYNWGNEERSRFKTVSNRYKHANAEILKHNFISTNSIFIAKEITDTLPFNENLIISEDWEYWIRLSLRAKFCIQNTVTSYITEHKNRSLNQIHPNDLLTQKRYFFNSLKIEEELKHLHYYNQNTLIAHFDSLIALNYALVGNKIETIRYFLNSLKLDASSLFNRRSLAIMKHLFLTW